MVAPVTERGQTSPTVCGLSCWRHGWPVSAPDRKDREAFGAGRQLALPKLAAGDQRKMPLEVAAHQGVGALIAVAVWSELGDCQASASRCRWSAIAAWT